MAAIIVGGLLQGGVFAVVAPGLVLVYRATGVINLSQGAFRVVGADRRSHDGNRPTEDAAALRSTG